MTCQEFLQNLYLGCEGYVEQRLIPASRDRAPIQNFSKLPLVPAGAPGRGYHSYFGVATRKGKSGKRDDVLNIPAVWADIDFKTFPTPRQAVSKLREFPLPYSAVILTGGGFHAYWFLREPAGQEEISAVEAINRGIAGAVGGDPASTDAARILRLPDTFNPKYDPPVLAKVVDYAGGRYNLSDFSVVKDEEVPASNGAGGGDGIKKIWEHCAFMRHCEEDARTLPEQEWFYMISNLSRVPGGVDKIHQISKPYRNYSRRETNAKILHSINASEPVSCNTISRAFGGCRECPTPKEMTILCPAAIRRR